MIFRYLLVVPPQYIGFTDPIGSTKSIRINPFYPSKIDRTAVNIIRRFCGDACANILPIINSVFLFFYNLKFYICCQEKTKFETKLKINLTYDQKI
jgi:hypothetical protein